MRDPVRYSSNGMPGEANVDGLAAACVSSQSVERQPWIKFRDQQHNIANPER